ncbi:hypothetical protein PQX77_007246 [Marasmius sp. AFHP31]|uniref:NADH dehydrogenase [ubiquinone] 1 alpha subcomplex subunit 11 n=1 Tax=Marasmius tenuissimus TaxID=585030 RepID=A0ABR3ADY9_9AGAR|nr:hypothetical protein PM082_002732 [Marasmius tenuissimus]KAK1229684.1 hypothetical protein PQX77_007246 [Marasmius sp. AFHP31]
MAAFEPKATLERTTVWGLKTGAVGVIYSTLQNALGQHSSGAAGVFTRTGGTITFFAAMGATFAFTESFVANQRQTDDALNAAAGGCAAGFLAGIRARSLPTAVAACAVGGVTMGLFERAGKFTGDSGWYDEDRRSKFLKKPLDLSNNSSDSQ